VRATGDFPASDRTSSDVIPTATTIIELLLSGGIPPTVQTTAITRDERRKSMWRAKRRPRHEEAAKTARKPQRESKTFSRRRMRPTDTGLTEVRGPNSVTGRRSTETPLFFP
jgi:hypothetical protein